MSTLHPHVHDHLHKLIKIQNDSEWWVLGVRMKDSAYNDQNKDVQSLFLRGLKVTRFHIIVYVSL